MAKGEAPDPKTRILEEIRDDVRKQSDLKDELLQELKVKSGWTTFSNFAKHPVILLALGSLLGAWLTARYQSREWDRQQSSLEQRHKIEEKIVVRDEVIAAVIQAHAAAQSAIKPIFYEDASTFLAKEPERTKEWDKESQAWSIARSRIEQKLELYFNDSRRQAKLAEILDAKNEKGNLIFVEVNNTLARVRKNPKILNQNIIQDAQKQSQEFKDLKSSIRKNILTPIEQVKIETKNLMQIMQDEIQLDLSKDQRPSFWHRFFD